MKTKFIGTNKAYKEILDKINGIINKDLYDLGYSIGDMPYFGIVGENLQNEQEILKQVESKFKDIQSYLESIIMED